MTNDDYQNFVDEFNITRNVYNFNDVLHHGLSLCAESGEIASKISKLVYRYSINDYTNTNLFSELGDVLYHLVALINHEGMKLEEIMEANVIKLKDRKERGVLIGDGDDR